MTRRWARTRTRTCTHKDLPVVVDRRRSELACSVIGCYRAAALPNVPAAFIILRSSVCFYDLRQKFSSTMFSLQLFLPKRLPSFPTRSIHIDSRAPLPRWRKFGRRSTYVAASLGTLWFVDQKFNASAIGRNFRTLWAVSVSLIVHLIIPQPAWRCLRN